MHIFEIYSDIGAGKYGTTHGVALLSEYSQKFSAKNTIITPTYERNAPKYHYAKNAEKLVPFFKNELLPVLQNGLKKCDDNNTFPIIISGDHASAAGNVAAFINHHKNKKIGMVWIDAHADMHTFYTTPSGNMHGMPVSAVMGLDNKDCQINTVDDTGVQYWEELKGLSDDLPCENLFFLGLRSFQQPERHLIDKHGIFEYSTEAHRQAGFDKVLQDLRAKLQQLDVVYVSFDIDALDDSLVVATGTPEPLGYTKNEMQQIFDAVLSLPQIKLFEITEFNPTLDDDKDKYQTIFDLFDYAIDKTTQQK